MRPAPGRVNHAGSSPPFELYETEMVGLGLSAGNIQIRESPTKASKGRYHTETTGGGGGAGKASSFFDVFLELSTDGGSSWAPAEDPIRVELAAPAVGTIPTVSEWGLIILTLLLLTVATIYLRRQRPVPSGAAAA